jgi:hypothetical protein
MYFKLICLKCDSEIVIKNDQFYDGKEHEISISVGPVGDDGIWIECKSCKEIIHINNYTK